MALDEVTYGSRPLNVTSSNGLEPGDFTQKWLLLEASKVEVDGGIQSPADQVSKDEFATEQIDVTEFDPNVTVGDKTYEWPLLESDIGAINFAHE